MTWHVLRCVGQRERWVAAELRRSLGLHSYVPIERNVLVLRGKKIERPRPLMPGYVFALGIHNGIWRDIAETRHVLGWLKVDGGEACSLTENEMTSIRDAERLHNQVLHDRRVFRIGERVRAKAGPFSSIESLLRSVRGSTATIEVPMLGSMRTAKVKLDDLEKV